MLRTSWEQRIELSARDERVRDPYLFVGQRRTKTIGRLAVQSPRAGKSGMTPRRCATSAENAVSVRRRKMSFPYKALPIDPGFVSPTGDETAPIRNREINSSH
jgi:hypothetical protein